MTQWKSAWMFVVMGVVLVGCPSKDADDDTCARDADCGPGLQCEQGTGQCVAREDRNLLCRTQADCLSTELCHPTSKVCVQTCESSTDCPDSTRTCAPMSESDSTRVCQCSTDALCNQDRQSANLVCSTLDTVCTPRCAADADCGADRTCDTATGQCRAPVERDLSCTHSSDCHSTELCHPTAGVCVKTCESSADCPDTAKLCSVLSATDPRKVCKCSTDMLCNGDSGTEELVCSSLDAVCTLKCTGDADCGTGRTCDTATGQCLADRTGTACTGDGLSSCDYGTDFCSSNICTPLPVPVCPNYTNFQHKDQLGTWATILHGARTVSFETDTVACATPNSMRVKIALSAYSNRPFPPTRGDLSGLFFVKSDGSLHSGVALVFSGADYSVLGEDRQRAEIVVSLCLPAGTTTISTGFYFTGGNFLCFQSTR
ncbi:hypothetical protein ACLESD_13420 [Pyxidicoccus sp. 3LFB2]